MASIDDIKVLNRNIREIKKKDDNFLLSIFTEYKKTLKKTDYEEYLVNGEGIKVLPESYKRQKYN